MSPWILLMITIIFEVAGTIAMKLSLGLTKVFPTIMIFISYGLCFSIFAIAIKQIELSVAYAIWSGVGTLIISIIGILLFNETISVIKIVSILFIILGVIGLKVTSIH